MYTKDILLLILGILGGIISTWLASLIKTAWYGYQTKQSQASGEWRTYIYDDNGIDIIKEDILNLKHDRKTGEFKGTIKRDIPLKQRHREWIFKGVFTKDAMLLVFWSRKEIPSYGVEYLVLTDDFKYTGYYLKHDKTTGDIFRVKIVNEKVH